MDAIVLFVLDIAERVGRFVDSGGTVLLLIAFVILAMWSLILERLFYLYRVQPRIAEEVMATWEARGERQSWEAHQIRRGLIGGAERSGEAFLATIKTLIALCPLLGLLGTVTGMIAVFDVMAFSGMGNPRLMASGVSKATVPTMAGMVGALSGLFAAHWVEQTVRRRNTLLADDLTMDH